MPKFVKTTVYLNTPNLNEPSSPLAVILGHPATGEWQIKKSESHILDKTTLSKSNSNKLNKLLESLNEKFDTPDEEKFSKNYINTISATKIIPFILSPLETIIVPDFNSGFDKIFGKKKVVNQDNSIKETSVDSLKDNLEDSQKEDLTKEEKPLEERSGNDLGEELKDENLNIPEEDNVRQLFGKKSSIKNEDSHTENYLLESNTKHELLREFVKTGFAIADLLDKTLEAISEPFLDKLYEENKKRALENPIYADIESRRISPDGNNILFAEENNLGIEELKIQFDIEKEVSKKPWWEKPLRLISDSPVSEFLYKGKYLYQRTTRSWDDRELWSLDQSFTKRLGEQLITLAHVGHGWPGGENGYPTAEEWEEALHIYGNALLEYSLFKDEIYYSSDLNTGVEYEELIENAKIALVWVAENLDSLWD